MENMRTLLRQNLGRSLADLPPADRLHAAWPVACGAALAGRGTIVDFNQGILEIHIPDPVWLAQLQCMAPMLVRELTRIARVPVTAIHFSKRTR